MFCGNVISITNQKGGVGKTTTSINVSTSIAALGKRVLLVDLDSQGNASTGFGITQQERLGKTSYDILVRGFDIKGAIIKTMVPRLHLIPSNYDLAGAEIEMSGMPDKEFILKNKLSEVMHLYDFIIIDCPPSLGLLTLNALISAQSILIPLQCEFFALEGLAYLLKTISLVKKSLNRSLEIEGILLTMYDRRNNLSKHVEQDVRKSFGKHVYKTVIPRNVKIPEASSHGKPSLIYDIRSPGSVAYLDLVREIIQKHKMRTEHEQSRRSAG